MLRVIALAGILASAACGFDGGVPIFGGGSDPDAGGGADSSTPDAPPDTPDAPAGDGADIAHLPPSEWQAGSIDVVIPPASFVEVNTDELDLGSLPDGLDIELVDQLGPGPKVAVVRVGSLTISEAATLRIWGEHPLIIISDGPVVINGLLTVAADRGRAGAGGFGPVQGPGKGGNGEHKSFRDGGGGGGGFGESGADGGDATTLNGSDADGGEGGAPYLSDILEVLVGGSGGGRDGLDCSYQPGAGGGAIQIYSYESITVASPLGAISAGGGGGGAGRLCPSGSGFSRGGGAGGGSGGAIYLQANAVTVAGRLAANGGGGGGGADTTEGQSGFNGQITSQASGGFGGGLLASGGGDGGFGDSDPEPGDEEDSGEGNAGGGGGGFGRIVISTRDSLSFDPDRSSPEAITLSF